MEHEPCGVLAVYRVLTLRRPEAEGTGEGGCVEQSRELANALLDRTFVVHGKFWYSLSFSIVCANML
jgi:hypothetical protein